MDAREIVQRMKDFGLKGVRDESAHFFISPDLLAEFVQSETERLRASLERCLKEAEGWICEARGCAPDDLIDYDGWADEARRLLGKNETSRRRIPG